MIRLAAAVLAALLAATIDDRGPRSARLVEAVAIAALVMFAGSPCRQRPVLGSELEGR